MIGQKLEEFVLNDARRFGMKDKARAGLGVFEFDGEFLKLARHDTSFPRCR